MRNRNKYISLMLALLLFLTGCGKQDTDGAYGTEGTENEKIVLHDPAEPMDSWEAAAYRDLFNAQVYSAAVFPETKEYSFDRDIVLDQFALYPGKTVRKGSVLAYANRESLEDSIERLEEYIQSMEEDFLKYKEDAEESLAESKEREEVLRKLSAYDAYKGQYEILAQQNEIAKQQILQRTVIYEMDRDYQLSLLAKLQKQIDRLALTSSGTGEVVAMQLYLNGDYIPRNQTLLAVGDPDHKIIKSDYINQSVIGSAESVYALINGKRYEVEYESIDSEEYARLSSIGESIYSTFELVDAEEDIPLGTYAAIVVIQESRHQVLTVPRSAIHKEGIESYVYCRDGDDVAAVPITIGMSDGAYTEVLSGLFAGDEVLVTDPIKAGDGRFVLEKGSFYSNYSSNGYFYYPRTYQVVNPVSHGTVYFVEYQVELNQFVQKGDVIATVRVEKDTVALERCETRLFRLRERLNELLEEYEKEREEEENASAKREKERQEVIEKRLKEIAEAEEELASIQADYATVQIVADHDGTVVQRAAFKKEDIIREGSMVAVIAEQETCYVLVDNPGQLLHYGNEVTVSYQNRDGATCEVTGKVVNLSERGISSKLKLDYSYILIPPEAVSEMAAVTQTFGGYTVRASYEVEARANEMKDVVLVPRSAVQIWQGKTYVVYVSESGELIAQSFVAGGYDMNYYWVVEGLTEGMEICSK